MVILIRISRQFNSFYFFLSHLSFADVWFSSNATPKTFENLLSEIETISYPGCLVQCIFFISCVHVEVFTLAVMVLDRFVAIGSTLLNGTRMSRTVCIQLSSFPHIYCVFNSLISTLWTHGLYFCGNIEINYFYVYTQLSSKWPGREPSLKNIPCSHWQVSTSLTLSWSSPLSSPTYSSLLLS